MVSCCTSLELNLQKNSLESSKTQNNFKNFSSKTSLDNFDVVDNPNTWENLDISFENKDLFETMKCEKNRWDSFNKKWPLKFINIDELVKSGFFYLQSDDKVQCAFCKLILCCWKVGDKPMKEHIKSSPKCSYLTNTENILTTTEYKPQHYFPHSIKCESTLSYSNHNKPKNPRMIDLKARLLTFKNWPHTTIKVQDLADCGLYYTGVQDVVTCFYCGGSLSKWEPSDEPIVEHAKFYPKCNYLQIIQNRPIYKRLKSVGSNFAMTVQVGENLPSQQAKDVLESAIVQRAKEIFPSSMVEEVVAQHLQAGENFSSLHHLCEMILQRDNKRSNPKVSKMKSSMRVHMSPTMLENGNNSNDTLLCKICMDSEREVVFQPCGHLISCEKCAARITKCPLCRKRITSRMRTFLS